MSAHLANLEAFLAVAVLGLALLLAVLGFISYRRIGHARILFISWGFLAFAVKGAYLLSAAWESRGDASWILPTAILDAVTLGFLYVALRVR